jgi:hypothetical protein
MRKVFFYILAGIVCIVVFTLFFSTGIGMFFMRIIFCCLIVPLWKKITKLGDKKNNESELIIEGSKNNE